LTTQDPNIQRTWNLEQGFEIQHELLPRVSVTASYYHGTFHDLLLSDNLNITLADWTPYQVFNPIDGTPLTIYDITAAAKGRAVDVFDTNSAKQKRTFNSYGFQFNARLWKGATLFGGFGLDQLIEDSCAEPDNPNLLRFCSDANLEGNLPVGDASHGYKIPYLKNGKLSGSMPMPYGFIVSGSLQSNMGYPNRSLTTSRTTGGTAWLLSRTTTYPTLNGVPYCPACAGGKAPWTANQVVLPTLRGTDTSSNLTSG
jgi:hypothetical protein